MEYLGFLINKKCSKKEWTPLKASEHNIDISHLFFADDLILFAKADMVGAKAIKDVLNKFFKESGQVVSVEKSCIYFSRNVPSNVKQDICDILDISETSALGKYLGFPINHKGAARNIFNFIAERLISKLAGWKAKFLSFVGRTVLRGCLTDSLSKRLSKDPNKLPCSSIWVAIKVGFPIFKQGICWSVGNKSELSFWESNWVQGITVRELIKGPLTHQEEAMIVADMHQNGSWDWGKISFVLPQDMVDRIQAISIQLFGEIEDIMTWRFPRDGEFNLSSAYYQSLPEHVTSSLSRAVRSEGWIHFQKSSIFFGLVITEASL
ncbi:uncharacterized protein LOC142631065 [Castanea sativa]|uniref:uncharacterized protein LOC142631065 n=1 Tax=Castanea sativa TaxID=21020 RepID=UPI003F6531F4